MSISNNNNVYEVITAYVDGQASPDEIAFLEQYRSTNRSVERSIQSEIQLRKTIRENYRKVEAPDALKSRCLTLIRTEASANSPDPQFGSTSYSSKINTVDKKTTVQMLSSLYFQHLSLISRWAVAAILLISVGFWLGRSYPVTSSPSVATISYPIEDHVQRHFMLASDSRIAGTHQINDITQAHSYLLEHFGMDVTIPTLKNATFAGIELSDFVPGYTTPMLKYVVEGIGDTILIFVFPLDKMSEDSRLVRDTEAVKTCRKDSDTHIKDIDGKHTVSWKWGDVWYVGVSDHNGEVLAAMLPTSN